MIRKYNLQWADRQLIKDKTFMSKYKRILSQVTRKEEVLEEKYKQIKITARIILKGESRKMSWLWQTAASISGRSRNSNFIFRGGHTS